MTIIIAMSVSMLFNPDFNTKCMMPKPKQKT